MKCTPREMVVTGIQSPADGSPMGNASIENDYRDIAIVTLRSAREPGDNCWKPSAYVSLPVKLKNLKRFPLVGETRTVEIRLCDPAQD